MSHICLKKLPFHLILDLDETLIHSSISSPPDQNTLQKMDPETRIRIKTFVDNGDTIWFIMRPYLTDFLRWAYKTFQSVIIWSAGADSYVKAIAKILSRYCHFSAVLTLSLIHI